MDIDKKIEELEKRVEKLENSSLLLPPLLERWWPHTHNHCWNDDGTCYGAYADSPTGKCTNIHPGIKKLGSKEFYRGDYNFFGERNTHPNLQEKK